MAIVRWNPARELSHMDPASAGRFELQFEMASERPPAAFGGSPPHKGENKLSGYSVISPS
jgi:hypothetical protein